MRKRVIYAALGLTTCVVIAQGLRMTYPMRYATQATLQQIEQNAIGTRDAEFQSKLARYGFSWAPNGPNLEKRMVFTKFGIGCAQDFNVYWSTQNARVETIRLRTALACL